MTKGEGGQEGVYVTHTHTHICACVSVCVGESVWIVRERGWGEEGRVADGIEQEGGRGLVGTCFVGMRSWGFDFQQSKCSVLQCVAVCCSGVAGDFGQ